MEILNYKPINKGFLVGKFDLQIPEWGKLTICECTLFEKDGKRWISLPSKQYEKDGQKKHFNLIRFDLAVLKKLEAAALLLLNELVNVPMQGSETQDEELPF